MGTTVQNTRRSMPPSWWPRSAVTAEADEIVTARTDDGLTLRIEHVRARGKPQTRPVVMQHGLAANGLAFNYSGLSLAEFLADHGFNCYIPALRGARRSQKPANGWSLDDLVERDVPAVIRTVVAHSRSDAIHWVGHSLGGILLMMHAAERPEVPVDGFVAVASGLDYRPGKEHNVYPRLTPFLSLAARVGISAFPFRVFAQLNAPLAGRGIKMLPEQMNFRRRNMDPDVLRGILASGFEKAPMPLLGGLASAFSDTGLERANGSIRYLEMADRFRPRALLLSGSRDIQCPTEAVEATAAYLKNARETKVMHFGRAHGHAEDYGHFDLIVGKNARREVWPHILGWLTD